MAVDPSSAADSAPTAAAPPASVPAVVAVLVTHDPGDWFEETLQSLADQTYTDLSVLVVDTASSVDPTERIHAVLPGAVVHRLEENPGHGAASNLVLEAVEGAAFHLFCHDDVALEPDTVRTMVEEAFRSNAGIVGPKLVDWHEPRRILQAGASVDKTGVMAPIAEPGELDQEQHDAVRDVFVVTGAAMLVRADLFEELGGFDEGIDHLGDDLDLCWRSHVLGARVIIAPAARVRHLEALGLRNPRDDRRRSFARHRLRTTLIAYGPFHRARVIPQAFVLAVFEAIFAIIAGRPGQAGDVLGAWTWNLRRMGQIRARRRSLKAKRRVSDGEIRSMQVRGSARINAFFRGQFVRREGQVGTISRSSRDVIGAVKDGSRQLTGAFALILIIILVIASRGLVTDGIPAMGSFSEFPESPRDLLAAYTSGWRTAGLGSPGPQPTAFGILGVLGFLFLGATDLLRSVLIVGLIPVGALGAWRLAKPIGSPRASVAAFAVYLAIPVPYNALARGSWGGLALYAASPWLLLLFARASGTAPYGPTLADPDSAEAGRPRRGVVSLTLSIGLLVGLVMAFVPFVVVIAVSMLAALIIGSLFSFRVAGVPRLLAIGVVGIGIAVLLNAPWSLDLLDGRSWTAITGVGAMGSDLDIGELLRLQSGPWGAPPLGFAFLLAGALPILIGRSWRLEWAVRAWFVVLLGWGAMWASAEGHIDLGLPAPEVILAPIAAALALTAALGLASFEEDLRSYRFGWRQIVSVLAALGVVAGAVPLGGGLLDGRWKTPREDHLESFAGLIQTTDATEGAGRVLWLGHAELLPADGWRYDDVFAFAATESGEPTVLDRFVSGEVGAGSLLADSIRTAETRRTNRVGHLLAPMGVRYIVLIERLTPTVTDHRHPAPERIVDALRQQLDLAEVPLREGMTVFENTAWISRRSLLPDVEGDLTDYTDAVHHDLTDAKPVLIHDVGAVGAEGAIPGAGTVLLASAADDGWRLELDGAPLEPGVVYGWANSFAAPAGGDATLTYRTPDSARLATAGQVGLWVIVLMVRRRARSGERRRELEAARGGAS